MPSSPGVAGVRGVPLATAVGLMVARGGGGGTDS